MPQALHPFQDLNLPSREQWESEKGYSRRVAGSDLPFKEITLAAVKTTDQKGEGWMWGGSCSVWRGAT